MMCKTAQRMGESKCLYCLLYCFMPCLPFMMLRGRMRERYGIEGSSCDDCMLSCCCADCVNCQMANELDAQEGKA